MYIIISSFGLVNYENSARYMYICIYMHVIMYIYIYIYPSIDILYGSNYVYIYIYACVWLNNPFPRTVHAAMLIIEGGAMYLYQLTHIYHN